jgi:hypothetical protein
MGRRSGNGHNLLVTGVYDVGIRAFILHVPYGAFATPFRDEALASNRYYLVVVVAESPAIVALAILVNEES